MAGPDDREPEASSKAGCFIIGMLAVILLLIVGFFVVDAVIGRQ